MSVRRVLKQFRLISLAISTSLVTLNCLPAICMPPTLETPVLLGPEKEGEETVLAEVKAEGTSMAIMAPPGMFEMDMGRLSEEVKAKLKDCKDCIVRVKQLSVECIGFLPISGSKCRIEGSVVERKAK